ncbi:MAG: hypothetical protein SF029_18075, partial [bacterium]|nr:hypothetical protein [bacterium]
WEDVRRIDAERPIEGIIIHESMFANADIAWTSQAARRGVAFALINLHYRELGQLRNDTCARLHPRNNPFVDVTEDYFYASYIFYLADNSRDRDLAYQSEFDTCVFNYNLVDQVQVLNDAYHYFLRSEQGVGGITHVYDILFGYVATIRIAEYNFRYRYLTPIATTPTAPPEVQFPTAQPLSSP